MVVRAKIATAKTQAAVTPREVISVNHSLFEVMNIKNIPANVVNKKSMKALRG